MQRLLKRPAAKRIWTKHAATEESKTPAQKLLTWRVAQFAEPVIHAVDYYYCGSASLDMTKNARVPSVSSSGFQKLETSSSSGCSGGWATVRSAGDPLLLKLRKTRLPTTVMIGESRRVYQALVLTKAFECATRIVQAGHSLSMSTACQHARLRHNLHVRSCTNVSSTVYAFVK